MATDFNLQFPHKKEKLSIPMKYSTTITVVPKYDVQSMGKRTLDAGQKNQAIPLREIVRYTELRSQSD